MIDKKAILEDCKSLRRVSILILEKAIPQNLSAEQRMLVSQKVFDFADAFKAAIDQINKVSPSAELLAKMARAGELDLLDATTKKEGVK
ncbi:hypothetical protein [Pseudomonas sp.]|uniref:hypothetical protein n=1 Tax=Pseudomonas sp. TaxID=306 RepID=UPI00333F220C